MFQALLNLLGFGKKVDYAQLVKDGATIIDVRSPSEFKGGHIDGSLNIPVETIEHNVPKLKKDAVIIAVCASGMRSAKAKSVLEANGFTDVYNGGGWSSLQNKISK